MPGKKMNHDKNFTANRAWQDRKRQANADPTHQTFQRLWRLDCLRTRLAEGRMTEKNQAEAKRLGLIAGE
jgi:hypothetical protein